MADSGTGPAPNLPELATRFNAGTWRAGDAAALWKLCASGDTVRAALARDLPGLFTLFTSTIEDIVASSTSEERLPLRMILAGEYRRARRWYNDLAAADDRRRRRFLLYRQAVLFVPIDLAVSIDALERATADAPDERDLRWMLGLLAGRAGQYDTATRALEQLLALERDAGELLPAAETAVALSRIAAAQKNLPLRISRYAEAVEYLTRGGGPTATLLDALDTLAMLYLNVDNARAWDAFRRGLELAMTSEDVARAGRALNGLWLIGTGPRDGGVEIDTPAERLIRRSLDWFAARGDTSSGAQAAMALGELADRRGSLDEAERFYERARALSQERADGQEDVAHACVALGDLHMRRKEYGDADRFFTTASEIYEARGMQGLSASLIASRGECLFLKGDRDAAREQWNRALARYTNVHDRDAARLLRQSMAKRGI